MTLWKEWQILVQQAKRRRNGRVLFPEDETLLKMDLAIDRLCSQCESITEDEKENLLEGLTITLD